MLEPIAPLDHQKPTIVHPRPTEIRPGSSARSHLDVMRAAFHELKRYDGNVSQSDPFLCRVEAAWRDKDADALMVLLSLALAERVEGY